MKEKRSDIRIPIVNDRLSVAWETSSGDLKLKDLSNKGMFFETNGELPTPKEWCRVDVILPGDLGKLALDGVVSRVHWRDSRKQSKVRGFAVILGDMSQNTQKIYEAYLVYMRNSQIIKVSKRIIEEFFGDIK